MPSLDLSDAKMPVRATKGKSITIYATIRDHNGDLVDFTGCTLSLVIYDAVTLTSVLTAAGVVTAGAVVRQFTCELTSAESDTVARGNYLYKIIYTDDGENPPFLTGTWEQVF